MKIVATFNNCISRINNTQVGDASVIDVVMPMYNLIEYIDQNSRTSGILWQFYKDVAAINNNNNNEVVDFNVGNAIYLILSWN